MQRTTASRLPFLLVLLNLAHFVEGKPAKKTTKLNNSTLLADFQIYFSRHSSGLALLQCKSLSSILRLRWLSIEKKLENLFKLSLYVSSDLDQIQTHFSLTNSCNHFWRHDDKPRALQVIVITAIMTLTMTMMTTTTISRLTRVRNVSS